MAKIKKIICVIAIINTIFLSGCTKINDLHKVAVVTSFAIDLEGENILLTCEFINPSAAGSSGNTMDGTASNISYIQGKGSTVLEAIRDVSLHFDRRLFFSHANTVIFGEEIAKRGIIPYIDLFIRDEQGRENIYLVVAKDAKGYELLGVTGELNNSSGTSLNETLENYKFNNRSVISTIVNFTKNYYDVCNEPTVSMASKIEEEVIGLGKEKGSQTKINIDVSGGAVFNKDHLIGYFNEEEILGFNFIVNKVEGGLIVFETKENLVKSPIIGSEKNLTTVEILRSKTKLDADIIDNNIHLYIEVNPSVGISEELKAVDLANKEIVKKIEEFCNEKIKKLVTKTMEKGQKEFKQDNFGVGKVIHSKYPEQWSQIKDEWNYVFSNITYEVKVNTTILKAGMMNVPANVRRIR